MTRRGSIDALAARLTGLYDAREARSIALADVAELSGLSPSALLTDPEAELAVEGLEEAAARLAAGEPLQYVVGHTEFYGRRFAVREGVLIPRADISDDALTVAAENFQQLGAAVTLRKADALNGLEEAFPERFDAIVSNPPYVPESDRAAMHPNVRDHEPGLALFVPDDDAIRFYRAIARAGRQMLTPGGRLWFEIYERAAAEIVRMLGAEGYTDTEVREDLFGKPRMVCTRLK